ncbi:hypothetical protein H5410_022111 [Solanum commersonii]|uniref:Uncharacterized protein n=1 Tax=Solanum commersonii TaxID=4109 RepID=A0A9J5ZIT2_SOLCO|nr:hypothetical protein H5410_022111 [Solanum commersonii]
MQRMPTIEEVREAVMGLNQNSARGPDGMPEAFYQSTCEIIGQDIHKMTKAFFCGAELPRFITHANLVLLPKKMMVSNFSYLRPISLNNMIILCKTEVSTMNMISETLQKYEEVSKQKVNKDKNEIYLHHSVNRGEYVVAEVAIGILRKEFPFTYLGCSIFYKRKQKFYYQQLIQRIGAKIQGWKGKLLSYGRQEALIKQVLQSNPTHYLSVMVLIHMQKMMTQFFWSSCVEGRDIHWSKWEACVYQTGKEDRY